MAEHTVIMENTLRKLLAEKKYATLREILITMNPADIAAIFDELEEDRLPLLYRLLPKELAADTFVEMDQEAQELLIRGFSDSELKEVLDATLLHGLFPAQGSNPCLLCLLHWQVDSLLLAALSLLNI